MDELQPLIQELPSIKTILSLAYYVLLGLFAVFTAIIYYHWTTYATDKTISRFTLVAYMVFTLPLLLIMGGIVMTI